MPFPPNIPPPDSPDGSLAEASAASVPEILSDLPFPSPIAGDWGFQRFEQPARPEWRTYGLHIGLFLITLLTTTLAGVELTRGEVGFLPVELLWQFGPGWGAEIRRGLWFALPFLGVLTVHEFGHYFTARHNRVRTSLPYYVPFPMGLGTFGAIIRIKDRIFSRREFFDIGLAGPLAGFLVAVPLLIYGLTHITVGVDLSLLYSFPNISGDPESDSTLFLSQPLLYKLLETVFADPTKLPPANELIHYPLLVAGNLALFFTALNLLPMGQLDGGHILYGLLGHRRFNRLALWLFTGFIFYAGLGIFTLHSNWHIWLYGGPVYALYLAAVFWRALPKPRQGLLLAASLWAGQLALSTAVPEITGNPGWLIFGLLLGRLTGIYHPPAPDEKPLSTGRKVLGWVMVGIFVLCFTPSPFY